MRLKTSWSFYLSSFRGLSKEVWWLALLTLINRAGAMVIPFLSLYLTKSKGFSLSEVGWIMSAFGVGSICGSWLGGYLNDKIGSYSTMLISLVCSGVLFVLAQFPQSMVSISIMIFFVMLFTDIFRPAMFVALRGYSKPENQTRSLSLIRLAINLGFSVGPAVGGFLIFYSGYSALFWADGITCLLAALLLINRLHPKKTVNHQEKDDKTTNQSAYTDWVFISFCIGLFLFGLAFLQYFSTIPLFYNDVFLLSEDSIGLLLAFNGFLVFALEMPLVHWIEQKKKNPLLWVCVGIFILLLSFVALKINAWMGWLWIGMVCMSFGEMFAFPFSNAFAMERAKVGKLGQYMGLYSIAFSISHVIGHNAGMQFVSRLGFPYTWTLFIGICILCIGFFFFTYRQTKNDLQRL
ncbi:MAG: MFS transporter [Bacteroidetes bacterium]|nr:MFS transporter [Bacteroidota bacterium]